MDRRSFLKAASAAASAGSITMSGASAAAAPGNGIQAFDYEGVRLLPSRWTDQIDTARAWYMAISDDDILHGFRAAAGLPAPGKPLGGWCKDDSATVFGQWLSGMARLSKVTADPAMRDKAAGLLEGWAKTIKPDGDSRMGHYTYDKLVCGLVDMHLYAGHPLAIPMLERVTAYASRTLDRGNHLADPSHNQHYYGDPQEWYTLSENLYRAYQATGNTQFRDFARVWLYHDYWNQFADTAAPAHAHGVHAYSHVNTFSSAAAAYAVEGDEKYLRIIRNAYDYLQSTQCYATGGYGPNERFMAPDGSLGRALDTRSDTFETTCGSWGGFKLSRYLMQFTGDSRYGDWMERLFYNGVGASLPLGPGGKNFYYSDYRVAGGIKVYYWDPFTCCSATYIQCMADYHNIIYYKDTRGLYVNQYVPSEVTWGDVKLRQETTYPDGDKVTITLNMPTAKKFRLSLRAPAWAVGMDATAAGLSSDKWTRTGGWMSFDQEWQPGHKINIQIPLNMRMQPVDGRHPNRVAIVRGPLVLVQDANYHDPVMKLPLRDEDLPKWILPGETATDFRLQTPEGKMSRLKLHPFYSIGPDFPYSTYFDRDKMPYALW
jgi:uncharacterized protein